MFIMTNSSTYDKSILVYSKIKLAVTLLQKIAVKYMVKHQYRSRNDIIASILEVANGNRVRSTQIQFKAYISYNLLKEYLVLLLKNGLLEYIEGERSFKTTAKGMQFLHKYNQMGELIMMSNPATKRSVSEFLF